MGAYILRNGSLRIQGLWHPNDDKSRIALAFGAGKAAGAVIKFEEAFDQPVSNGGNLRVLTLTVCGGGGLMEELEQVGFKPSRTY